MTPESWKKVETAMQGPFGRAVLLVDGYTVTLEIGQVKPLRFEIGVYVNGWMKGEWLMKDCEERRRFCRPIHRSVYSPKSKRELSKISKRALKDMKVDLDAKITGYLFHWASFSALKRHLVKNNQSIELQECFP